MPIFKVSFERNYTITEGFDRYVEADDLDHAMIKADELADEFNDDCPDDCSETGGGSAGDFSTGDFVEVKAAPVNEEIL